MRIPRWKRVRKPRRPHRLAMVFCWLMVVFLVLFPKGGVKLGPLPLTWGYLFLAASVPPLLLVRLLVLPLQTPLRALVILAALVPMQILTVYAGMVYGIISPPFTVSTIVGLFILPWVFLFVYPAFLRFVDGERLSAYFRWSVLLAAIWGIFLFFWHPFTGHYIEVPYLTVNSADYGELENTKNIARGLFFKLISTYNNGNLYGVATLMLLPLYCVLEKARWRRLTVKAAILLTLSRSVWAGLVISEALPLVLLLLRQAGTFPILYLGKAGRSIAALTATIGLVFASLLFNSSNIAFLFDPTFGNRTSKIAGLFTATLLPTHGLYGFDEVLYASAAEYWGYAGLAAFCLFIFSPIALLLLDRSSLHSPTRRAALKGLILYMVMAAADGAFNYIPVMAFYWFVYMIYIYGWPAATSPAVASAPARPRRPVPTPALDAGPARA